MAAQVLAKQAALVSAAFLKEPLPGNANLPIGVLPPANREIGVPKSQNT